MARATGSSGAKTLAAIHEAGLDLIHEHGFEAMSLRQLAARVGVQPSSLYNHIATKQDLLFDLIHNHMVTLLASVDDALAGTDDPVESLKAFIAFHLTYHIERKREVFIGSSELRSLTPQNRRKIVALRRTYEDRLCDILRRGERESLFKIADVRVSAYAILAMLTGICTWYDVKGRIGRKKLIDIHTRLVLEGVTT